MKFRKEVDDKLAEMESAASKFKNSVRTASTDNSKANKSIFQFEQQAKELGIWGSIPKKVKDSIDTIDRVQQYLDGLLDKYGRK